MPGSSSTETTIHEREASSTGPTRAERLAVAAHDLRSPLNAILGWARILAIKHGGDADVAAIAERIERSGRTQLKIIEELSGLAHDEREAGESR